MLLAVQVVGLYAPSAPGPDVGGHWDKVAHVLGFALPAAVATLLRARWTVAFLLVHAFVSEPLQGALAPERSVDLLDALADLVGVAVGAAVGVTLTHHGVASAARGAVDGPGGKMGGWRNRRGG